MSQESPRSAGCLVNGLAGLGGVVAGTAFSAALYAIVVSTSRGQTRSAAAAGLVVFVAAIVGVILLHRRAARGSLWKPFAIGLLVPLLLAGTCFGLISGFS